MLEIILSEVTSWKKCFTALAGRQRRPSDCSQNGDIKIFSNGYGPRARLLSCYLKSLNRRILNCRLRTISSSYILCFTTCDR